MDLNDPFFQMIRKTQDLIDKSISPSMRALAGVPAYSRTYDNALFKTINQSRIGYVSSSAISRMLLDITNNPTLEDIQRKAVLDTITGNSISALSRYDWRKDFPKYFTSIEDSQLYKNLDSVGYWKSKIENLETFNTNFQSLANLKGFEFNTIPDALTVALNIDLEDNDENESTSKLIDQTNQLIIDIQNIDGNNKSQFYEIFDAFIIRIGEISNSKRFNEIVTGVIIGVVLLLIQQWFFSSPSEVNNSTYNDNSTNTINQTVNQITNIIVVSQSEIENGKIYCSTLIKDLKASKDDRSKTILNIPIGTKIKVLKKYRTWLWVRVLDGNEFPDGFIKNADLYAIKH